ncbi:PilZ domain-containing protein [bacterium]|nr:PilZ domain-containing protein [bacterium]
MNELVKIDQKVTIIPKDIDCTNKGFVTEVSSKGFKMKMRYPTKGIKLQYIYDFYSQTPNGILYFTSHATEMTENELFIANPIKHRFLQRRQFTRIKFLTESKIVDKSTNKEYAISTLDLSAGGMKFLTDESINLDVEYKVDVILDQEQTLECSLQLIRIEKQDDGKFALSGRFVNQSNVEKMTLIQYCLNKNIEAENK